MSKRKISSESIRIYWSNLVELIFRKKSGVISDKWGIELFMVDLRIFIEGSIVFGLMMNFSWNKNTILICKICEEIKRFWKICTFFVSLWEKLFIIRTHMILQNFQQLFYHLIFKFKRPCYSILLKIFIHPNFTVSIKIYHYHLFCNCKISKLLWNFSHSIQTWTEYC